MSAPPKPARRGRKPKRPIARSKEPIPRRSRPAAFRRTDPAKERLKADREWARAIRAKGPCAAIGETFFYKTRSHFITEDVDQETVVITRATHRCADPLFLEAAHIIRRGYAATRTDLDNGLPLCHFAHAYFTERPEAWINFVKRKIGVEKYEALRIKALEGRA